MIPEEHRKLVGTTESKRHTMQDLSSIYFHTASEFAAQNLFVMEASGNFICSKHYQIDRYASSLFNSYLAILTLSGSGTIVTDLGTRTCETGDIVFIDCSQTHTYYANENWNFCWFHFSGNTSDAFVKLLLDGHHNVFRLADAQAITNLFVLLMQYKKIHTLDDELAISSYIHQILSLTYSAAHSEHFSRKHSGMIAEAIEYIEEHYDGQLTVEEIAQHLSISKSSFCHLFRAETNFSPYDYILTVRINKAKTLLLCTTQNIDEIAWTVGYNSSANFIRAFRQKTGITPTQFRHTQKNILSN